MRESRGVAGMRLPFTIDAVSSVRFSYHVNSLIHQSCRSQGGQSRLDGPCTPDLRRKGYEVAMQRKKDACSVYEVGVARRSKRALVGGSE